MTQFPSPSPFRRGGKDYRHWTKTHKRQIMEETFAPGVSVSVVALRHDVNVNQLFTWVSDVKGFAGKGGMIEFVKVRRAGKTNIKTRVNTVAAGDRYCFRRGASLVVRPC